MEFPVVVLYGVRKGTLPLEWGGRCDQIEEERRLLYVGMTRAREELIMTTSGQVSPLLDGISREMAVWDTIKSKSNTAEGKQLSLFDFMR